MKIGIAEWGLREIPFEEHFKFARELGISALEIGVEANCDYRLETYADDKDIESITSVVEQFHINTSFGCIGGGYDIEDEKELEDLVKSEKDKLKALAKLNVKIVRIFVGWSPVEKLNEKKRNNMMTALNELDACAGMLDMKLAIETHGSLVKHGKGDLHINNVSTDWEELHWLLPNLPPHTGILFDPGNLRAVIERPLMDYVELLNPYIIALHIKDWTQYEDGSWSTVAVGETEFDWAPIFKAMSFDGVGLIEYENPKNVNEGMKKSIEYLEKIGFDKN